MKLPMIRIRWSGFTPRTGEKSRLLWSGTWSGQNSFPDGIVCYNDQIAVQVMEELERQGKKIPEDVAVTGYDNSLYARQGGNHYYHPSPEKNWVRWRKVLLEKIEWRAGRRE